MGRNNREGTNALIKSETTKGFSWDQSVIDAFCKHLNEKEAFIRITSFNEDLLRNLHSNLYKIVLNGNLELAKLIIVQMEENGGYGLNQYHRLALTAVKVDELQDMMRINAKKKSPQNQ